MEIKLLSGALGAEVSGINLKDSSVENWNKINTLLLEHKALFFRDQSITSEEQINLAKHFGPLERHIYVKGREKYPEILRIIKEPDEKRQWGETWHTDVSYNPKPTKVIILKSLKVPPVGGDTMFSNMEIAYETLDNKIKDKIKDKKATHSSLGAAAFTRDYKAMEGNGNLAEYSNAHPMVRTHPETGKKILYVNSMYTKKILDLEEDESEDILSEIFKHQERLDFTCRFKWTENAVAIWDNRSTLHQGLTDFFPGRGLGHERIMDRIAVEGDQPN
jgi:taurine dioxygenase